MIFKAALAGGDLEQLVFFAPVFIVFYRRGDTIEKCTERDSQYSVQLVEEHCQHEFVQDP